MPSRRRGKPPIAPVDASPDAPDEAAAPKGGDAKFPIVGIGASAGGLAAFEAFFSGMPADRDPGMAFVLVQHLAPDHKSHLAELVRRYTRMQVFEVEDGMEVAPNCAYIIPPARDMAFIGGRLQLLEPAAPRGQRLPVDFLFRSLAQDQRERAIGIVLSGTGSDGTLGVRAIKGEGGMVMVQKPESTEFNGMPQSALATGLVDFCLPPASMPDQLITYVERAFRSRTTAGVPESPAAENALKKVFILLRIQTGHDFSQYKPSTIHRRIARRMAVQQVDTMEAYVKFLQDAPAEVDALFRDLLIGVTRFFRDAEAFSAFEELVVPRLFQDRPADRPIRVWVPGCSTGEEAYSLAIILRERAEALKLGHQVQIFATDIDAAAVNIARAGVYSASIASDVRPDRLARYFSVVPGAASYRVHKVIRDMLVFSEQDLIRDPPFSKLDLISCRNLLIYLDTELQRIVIPLFHYALKPGGTLFLGTSETVGEYADLFSPLERKMKIFTRKGEFRGTRHPRLSRYTPPLASPEAPHRAASRPDPTRRPLKELTEQALLRQLPAAAALVNARGDVLYLHGRTGMYLEPAPGDAAVSNILKMAREGLRHDLATALHKVTSHQEVVHVAGLRVKTNGHFTLVDLTISAVNGGGDAPQEPLYLVILREAQVAPHLPNADATEHLDAQDERVLALLGELRSKDEYIQSSREEVDTATEELKASNEEMQSMNEELQASNEELETSKEELQSVNEELATVNTELQTKVADLSRANNDMNNLLAGTGIGTVFVDHELRVLRFTPAITSIIPLIPGDIGRPVSQVVASLIGYDRLSRDTQSVLDTLLPREFEVEGNGGLWYSVHIQPYRTLDNVIEGAVITFVNVTEQKKARDALLESATLQRLAAVVRDSTDAVTLRGLDGRMLAWNPGATTLYGWTEAEVLEMHSDDLIPPPLRKREIVIAARLARGEVLAPYRTKRLARNGKTVDVWLTCTALLNADGAMYAIATTEKPILPKVTAPQASPPTAS